MYRAYKDKVKFHIVYVQEAHPSDGWQVPANTRDGVVYASPKTNLERAKIADDCLRNLKITIPCLVDDMSNTVRNLYHGWPARVCIVRTNGTIAFISASSPGGMNPPDIDAALRALLAQPKKEK